MQRNGKTKTQCEEDCRRQEEDKATSPLDNTLNLPQRILNQANQSNIYVADPVEKIKSKDNTSILVGVELP